MLTGKTFVDPLEMPFSRRGSYISFANANGGSNQFGKAQLFICTSRYVAMSGLNAESAFRQIKVELIKDGIPRNCVYHTTPYELIFANAAPCVSVSEISNTRGAGGRTG